MGLLPYDSIVNHIYKKVKSFQFFFPDMTIRELLSQSVLYNNDKSETKADSFAQQTAENRSPSVRQTSPEQTGQGERTCKRCTDMLNRLFA